jgi:hypothetical protein
MDNPPTIPQGTAVIPATRPVLCWNPSRDKTVVKADVEEAAAVLESTPEAVLNAINNGDLLAGWFLDWAAPSQSHP